MEYVIVRQQVKDYLAWKQFFDSMKGKREENGMLKQFVFRNETKPNEVMILFNWKTLEQAEQFLLSDKLKEVRTQAGAIGDAEIYKLAEGENPEI